MDKSTRLCCSSGLCSLFTGLVQLVLSSGILVLVSMVAEGFRDHIGEETESTYIVWYILSVGVAVVSAAHCMLAVLLMWATYKSNFAGLLTWVSVMVATSLLQTLVMLGALVMVLREGWDCAPTELAAPRLELKEWKIRLTPMKIRSVACLLVNHFGTWLLCFGIYWCCVLCVNSFCLQLIHNKLNKKKQKRYNVHDMELQVKDLEKLNMNRNSCDNQIGDPDIPKEPTALNHMPIEGHNMPRFYPFSDLYSVLANEAAARQWVAGLPSAPSLSDIESVPEKSDKNK